MKANLKLALYKLRDLVNTVNIDTNEQYETIRQINKNLKKLGIE